MSLVEGRLWSKLLMLPRPTVSDARHYIWICLQATLAASLHGVNHNMPFPTAPKSLFSTFSVLSILRVRDKLLISNMILQLWADVKYHVPTGFGFSPKASGFYPFDDATDLVRGRRWWCGVADSSFGLKSDMPQH